MRQIEDPLADVGRGQRLAHQRFRVTSEAPGQLREVLCTPGAGPSADGRPLAGEHGSEDGPRLAEVPDQRLLRDERVVEESSLKW